jgi:thiol:disulfide interchange protein DsbD
VHRWKRLYCVTIFLVLSVSAAIAQHSGKNQKVAVQIKLEQDRVRAGSTGLAILILDIQKGWHINSTTPSDESLIATLVEVKQIDGIGSISIGYPEGIRRQFDFSETPLDVYEGTIQIPIKFSVATTMKPGTYSIPLVVHYQACSTNICMAPASAQVNFHLQVVSKKGRISRINKELFEGLEVHK